MRFRARTAWPLSFRVIGNETGGHGVETAKYIERSAVWQGQGTEVQ